jgi:GTP-binding protein
MNIVSHVSLLVLLFQYTGKTTLVDSLLVAARRASGAEASSLNRLMDSGELEIERGITITSKVTRFAYKDQIINCVDTPGHADFCGEVDRILSK